MGGAHRGDDRQEDRGQFVHIEPLIAPQALPQCLAGQQLQHHQRCTVVELEHIFDPNDVGVLDRTRRACLADEAFALLRAGGLEDLES